MRLGLSRQLYGVHRRVDHRLILVKSAKLPISVEVLRLGHALFYVEIVDECVQVKCLEFVAGLVEVSRTGSECIVKNFLVCVHIVVLFHLNQTIWELSFFEANLFVVQEKEFFLLRRAIFLKQFYCWLLHVLFYLQLRSWRRLVIF